MRRPTSRTKPAASRSRDGRRSVAPSPESSKSVPCQRGNGGSCPNWASKLEEHQNRNRQRKANKERILQKEKRLFSECVEKKKKIAKSVCSDYSVKTKFPPRRSGLKIEVRPRAATSMSTSIHRCSKCSESRLPSLRVSSSCDGRRNLIVMCDLQVSSFSLSIDS